MLSWKPLLVVVPVLLSGCTYGVTRNAIQERLNDGSLQTSDTAISDIRGLKPQLQFPCRIALYLKPGQSDWRWTPEDKAAMQQWAAELKREGIASDVFPLPDLLVSTNDGKTDVKALRLAAARCGADALFVVHGASQTESHQNFAAVFDLTIVGGFVIPASHRDSLFRIEGVLLDVDNGFIYTTVQAEGEGKIMRPTFVIEDKDAVEKAKVKALQQFGAGLLNQMRILATTPPSQRVHNARSVQTDDPRPKPKPIPAVMPAAATAPGVVVVPPVKQAVGSDAVRMDDPRPKPVLIPDVQPAVTKGPGDIIIPSPPPAVIIIPKP